MRIASRISPSDAAEAKPGEPAAGETPALAPPAPLTRTVSVRISPWRARVFADAILPTQPLPARADESLAVLRERMLAEHEARLPAVLRSPTTRTGVVLLVPAALARERLSWVNRDDQPAAGGNVDAGRAEISWANAAMEQGGAFRLERPGGIAVAEVEIESTGRELTVRTTEDIRAWLQLAIETGAAGETGAANATRFSWKTGVGAPLSSAVPIESESAATRRHGQPGAPESHFALGGATGAVLFQSCALFDRDTGWAIVSDIRQAADRPLGQ